MLCLITSLVCTNDLRRATSLTANHPLGLLHTNRVKHSAIAVRRFPYLEDREPRLINTFVLLILFFRR